MVITCDIGNSRIKAGIFKENKLTEVFICESVSSLIENIRSHRIKEVAVSSVVPAKSEELEDALFNINIRPIIITNNSKFNLTIDYNTPETLGIDRICSAEGAFFLSRQKRIFAEHHIIISIDFGTATTINVVTYPGVFRGGIIAPGIDLMFRSLSKGTSQLPLVYQTDFKNVIGKTTRESIASGVLYSAAGLMDRVLKSIDTELKPEKVYIYTTGGNYIPIKPFLGFNHEHKEQLVLQGINAIYEKNKRKLVR